MNVAEAEQINAELKQRIESEYFAHLELAKGVMTKTLKSLESASELIKYLNMENAKLHQRVQWLEIRMGMRVRDTQDN